MPNPWNYTNRTCISISKGLQIPLEMVQNWRRTFCVRKGRPGKAQPGRESVNNPYQGWLIDPSVKPDVLDEFSTKLLATCAVRFFSVIAFRWYQVDQNRYCGGGGIDEVRLDLIMTQVSMYFIRKFQYETRSPLSPECLATSYVTARRRPGLQ